MVAQADHRVSRAIGCATRGGDGNNEGVSKAMGCGEEAGRGKDYGENRVRVGTCWLSW